MATIKSYTDVSQSKTLSNILPLESADMHYSKDFDGRWFVDLAAYTSVKIPKYVDKVEEHLLPCWSLAALLNVIPNYKLSSEHNYHTCTTETPFGKETVAWFDNPIDACYELILKLNELNLL